MEISSFLISVQHPNRRILRGNAVDYHYFHKQCSILRESSSNKLCWQTHKIRIPPTNLITTCVFPHPLKVESAWISLNFKHNVYSRFKSIYLGDTIRKNPTPSTNESITTHPWSLPLGKHAKSAFMSYPHIVYTAPPS